MSWGIVLAIALSLTEVLPMSFTYTSSMAKFALDCPLGPWSMVFGSFGTLLLSLCTTQLILFYMFYCSFFGDILEKVRPQSASSSHDLCYVSPCRCKVWVASFTILPQPMSQRGHVLYWCSLHSPNRQETHAARYSRHRGVASASKSVCLILTSVPPTVFAGDFVSIVSICFYSASKEPTNTTLTCWPVCKDGRRATPPSKGHTSYCRQMATDDVSDKSGKYTCLGLGCDYSRRGNYRKKVRIARRVMWTRCAYFLINRKMIIEKDNHRQKRQTGLEETKNWGVMPESMKSCQIWLIDRQTGRHTCIIIHISYTYTYTYAYTDTHTYTYAYTDTYTYTYAYTCIYVYIHIYICMHHHDNEDQIIENATLTSMHHAYMCTHLAGDTWI